MLFEQIARNKKKTIWVLFLFFIILALVGLGAGYLCGNHPVTGLIATIIFSIIYVLIVMHDPANLVMKLNHAKEVDEQSNPELYHIVQDMAMVAQVPMPKVYIISDKSPNAFATGRDPEHSAVAVTQGLLDLMNREELEGVIGHEISHVRNYDIRLSTIAAVLVAAISYISGFLSQHFWIIDRDNNSDSNNPLMLVIKIVAIVFTLILGPLCAVLAQMALSRNRENLADAGSVELTRNPQGLISALTKIENSAPMKTFDPSCRGLYIEDPAHKKGKTSLFDSHPSTEERIKRLEKM